MATAAEPTQAEATTFRPWPMTVDHYERMIAAGVFTGDERVFLWKGQLVEKMGRGRPHTVAVLSLMEALRPFLVGFGYLEPEQPVKFVRRNDSMPEPDIMVVRGSMRDYAKAPKTRDVRFLVEVSESTLLADR